MFFKMTLRILKKKEQEHLMRVPTLGCSCFFTKKFKLKKGHNSSKNRFSVISPFVHISLLIVNIYFEFQVYVFSNGRDLTKCQFLHDNNDVKCYSNTTDFYLKTADLKNMSTFTALSIDSVFLQTSVRLKADWQP